MALLGLPPPPDPSWLDPDPTLLLPDLICSLAIFCIWRSLSSTVSSWESLLSGEPSWKRRAEVRRMTSIRSDGDFWSLRFKSSFVLKLQSSFHFTGKPVNKM